MGVVVTTAIAVIAVHCSSCWTAVLRYHVERGLTRREVDGPSGLGRRVLMPTTSVFSSVSAVDLY